MPSYNDMVVKACALALRHSGLRLQDVLTHLYVLLPVLDNLQRATNAAETSDSTDVIAEGIRRTAASFESALAAAGVEPIDAIGEPFNPELHEAVETAEGAPEDEGRVIAQHTRGYKIGERLLRPARVKVGRYTTKANKAGD